MIMAVPDRQVQGLGELNAPTDARHPRGANDGMAGAMQGIAHEVRGLPPCPGIRPSANSRDMGSDFSAIDFQQG